MLSQRSPWLQPKSHIAPSGLGRRLISAGEEGRVRLEVAAVVGSFFIADSFGLGFRALIVFAGVVELAIAAGVQVGVAPWADVARSDTASGGIFNLLAAFLAVEKHGDK